MNQNKSPIYNLLRFIWRQIKKVKAYASYVKYKLIKPKLQPGKENKVNIVVSFTSYPARVKCLPLVVGSLVRQTRKPNKIVLYLSKQQFADSNDPVLASIRKQGVEVRLCNDDMRSHKKYLYAMQEFPEDIIITVDDDILYDKNLIEDLYQSYLRHPGAVSAKRVHKIKFDQNNRVKPYKEWDISTQESVDKESLELIATGCGGVLYPPHCLHNKYHDIDIVRDTCMHADDLWLKIMELMKGTPTVLVQSNNYKLNHAWDTECNGLALENVGSTGNDGQLKNICDYFSVDLYKLIHK